MYRARAPAGNCAICSILAQSSFDDKPRSMWTTQASYRLSVPANAWGAELHWRLGNRPSADSCLRGYLPAPTFIVIDLQHDIKITELESTAVSTVRLCKTFALSARQCAMTPLRKPCMYAYRVHCLPLSAVQLQVPTAFSTIQTLVCTLLRLLRTSP